MGILGLLLGIARIEHQSNTDIRKKIIVDNVNSKTGDYEESWLQHII
jgi:hypothetical protein